MTYTWPERPSGNVAWMSQAWSSCSPPRGLIIASDTSEGTDDFVAAIAKHRHFAREPIRRACEDTPPRQPT
jgi:hypothetical protein